MTVSLRLVSFSIHRLHVCVLHVQFRTSVTLISAAKNDVGKRLNFRSRLAVAVRISPQVETFRFGTFPGRFRRLQSGLERKQMLDNQQTDHFIQLSASGNPVSYYQFVRASFHSVTSRKRLLSWEVQGRYQSSTVFRSAKLIDLSEDPEQPELWKMQCQRAASRLAVFLAWPFSPMRGRFRRKQRDYTEGREIPNLFILSCRVDRFSPRCTAAPFGPATTQLHSDRALTICCRSDCSRTS